MPTFAHIDLQTQNDSVQIQIELKSNILSENITEVKELIQKESDFLFTPWVSCNINLIKGVV